ncbi:Exportin-6-A [Lamellibrachia satsuma]|nr:Exportin-6-A [Lamellibrachia satsuma]
MNDSYVDKFTEFFQLFVSIHLRRFEAHSEFPMLDLLALLFKYTFKQPSNDGFFSCLEIWGTFIDYLNTKLTTRSSDRQTVLARYQEVLLSLARQILQNLQFRYNQSRLDELDDEVLDDDSETEWQHFLRQYLETVAKVADLFPQETFRLVGEPFQENVDIYLALERHIVVSGKDPACSGRCLAITAENECRRLHCSLRDLSSLLQMLGRLSHHFIGEHFMQQFSEARALIQRLIETALYGSRVKLYEVKTSVDGVLQSDFIEVHAQAFAAVKAYSSWLAQFYVESKVDEMQRLKCTEMINTVVDTVLPMFTKEPVAERVAQSAAHLLLSVFTTVKPPFLLHVTQVQTFYNDVSHSLLARHSKEVQLLVYRSPSNYLLLFQVQLLVYRSPSNYLLLFQVQLLVYRSLSNYLLLFQVQLLVYRSPSNYLLLFQVQLLVYRSLSNYLLLFQVQLLVYRSLSNYLLLFQVQLLVYRSPSNYLLLFQVQLLVYRSLSNYLLLFQVQLLVYRSLSNYLLLFQVQLLVYRSLPNYLLLFQVQLLVYRSLPNYLLLFQVQLLIYRSLPNYLLLFQVQLLVYRSLPNYLLLFQVQLLVYRSLSNYLLLFQVQLLVYRSLSNYLLLFQVQLLVYRSLSNYLLLFQVQLLVYRSLSNYLLLFQVQLLVYRSLSNYLLLFQVQLLVYRSLSNYLLLFHVQLLVYRSLSNYLLLFQVQLLVYRSLSNYLLLFQVQLLVYRSLSNYLLLGWLCCSDAQQEWSVRAASHQAFVKQLTLELCQLRHVAHLADNKALQEEAKPCIKKVLHIAADLIESMAVDGVSRSKQICYQSVDEVIQTVSFLFPIYIRQSDVTDEILGFFMATFQCLRTQMGAAFTEQMIRTFMTLFTKEQLAEIIQNESEAGIKVVDRFLKILELIVQEPGSAFKAFLPNIISICMDHIYPIIAQKPTVDIKPALYELLHELLQNNWRYFFKDSVLTVLKSSQNDENVENQQQFIDIMQAFGQSFLQPDIAIFRQTLQTLQDLNSKWKLYHKGIFRETMLYQFLTVLLQVLVCRSHDLLQEEIGVTVYNMASVDFDTFYACFLPTFLAGCDGIDASQKAVLAQNFKMDCDLPSFSQSLQRFVSDLRYYRLCNSSLPAGSVHF